MYKPTIGLEIHIELKTKSKMFCSCFNNPEEKNPNVNICPICLGHPGVLPTINKEAVLKVIKLGLALKGRIGKNFHFDRKNYFYPDLPKGYQISQYENPLVEGGELAGIRIRRIHLEEDTGRLLHEIEGGFSENSKKASYVDFNRAGVPLMELVTEPDIKSAEEAVFFGKELQLILRYLDISNADMEKGQMRIEANISLSDKNLQKLGTKVEVKNINSFKAVYEAIQYELKRQEKILEEGGEIYQETRGWDDLKKETISQRTKEEAHDYRYFFEPDLPLFDLNVFNLELIKKELPELPAEKRERFVREFGLDKTIVEILVSDKKVADYFEQAASELRLRVKNTDYSLLTNYYITDLRGLMMEKGIGIDEININPEHFAHLVSLVEENKLSSRLAKDLLRKMAETGADPETIINSENLRVISSEQEIEEIVKEIIVQNPKALSDYKKGKVNALQFLIGQAMAKTKGQADPEKLKKVFEKFINF